MSSGRKEGGVGGGNYRGNRRADRYGREEDEEDSEEVFMEERGRTRRGNRRNRGYNEEGRGMETYDRDCREEEEVRRGGEKRTLDQRSPNTEEERRNRQRLEFELGNRFGKITDTMKEEVEKIIGGMGSAEGGDLESLKKWVTKGLRTLVNAVEKALNEMGEAVAYDRKEREDIKKDMGERMRKMEELARSNEVRMEVEKRARETERKKESVREMEKKLEIAKRQLKIMDIDYGKVITERKEIVDRTLEYMREEINLRERKRFDIVIRRTRIIVLGKETKVLTIDGRKIHTVPILMEFRNEEDKMEVEAILRGAEFFGAFHWPLEIMGFVKEVREEVKKMGYGGERQHIRIRPEEREGRMQIRADVKDKTGGRFWSVATWAIPTMEVELRGNDAIKPKWQRPSGRR
jgi:hypothetical protein